MKVLSIKQIISDFSQILEDAGIEDARFNVNCMVAKALKCSLSRVPLHWESSAEGAFGNTVEEMIRRRLKHEPLQYILADWSFTDFDVLVGSGALIPRPETEEVFMAACRAIDKAAFSPDFLFVDVGTGTGILGLAIARRFKSCRGWLADISPLALGWAQKNLQSQSVLHGRLALLRGSLLDSFSESSLQVVISNPPYIASSDIPSLMPEVRDYEPLLALDGGGSGLELIHRLIQQSFFCLTPGGILIFEHGHGQRSDIISFLDKSWSLIEAGDDLSGRERFLILRCEKPR